MKISGNTILITGGATGIGLALAARFLKAGSEVIVCGRREDKLKEAEARYPGLKTRVCDVGDPEARIRLVEALTREFPNLNVLINNAGIQRRMEVPHNPEPWRDHQQEIAINLEAPIHLAMLLIPHLEKQRDPVIANVSSGLAFVPLALAPIYSATKAALHSFTLSLRYQLRQTPIQVREIIPPAVNTDLGGPGLHTWGADLDEFADAIMAGLERGDLEVGFGTSEKNRRASREELDQIFSRMNPA